MTELTIDLPRNSSRTSTQAVTVPSTPLIRTTMKAVPKVSLSAPTASGLEIACQNVSAPSRFDSQTRAAIGRTTITVRNVESTPTDRAVLPRPAARILLGGAAVDAVTELMGGTSDRSLDSNHPSAVQVEPHPVDLPPAAEEPVVDAEGRAGVVLLAPTREVRALQHRLGDRAIAVGGEDPLLLGRVHVLDKGPGGRRRV